MKRFILERGGVFLTAAVVYLIGQYYRGVWFVGADVRSFCSSYFENGNLYCNSPYIDTLGYPLIAAGEFLAVVAVVLLFAGERGFRAWLKLSAWYLPLAVIGTYLLSQVSINPITLMASYPAANYTFEAQLFGFLYVLLTIGAVLRGRVLEKGRL